MNNIEKTIEYIKNIFDQSEYLKDKQTQKEYRFNHTIRVANIGKEIAIEEGMNLDAVVVGCLLHDISYIEEMKTSEERTGHGRRSAAIARDFVNTLELDEYLKQEVIYGVAIHVDDKADFEGEHTVLAGTISDCDNIDRFDKYRLYESLLYSKLDTLSLLDQIEFVEKRISGLSRLKNHPMQTKTATRLWNAKLDYQIQYFEGLQEQLHRSKTSSL